MNQITNVCGGPCKALRLSSSSTLYLTNYPQVFVGNTRNPFARARWCIAGYLLSPVSRPHCAETRRARDTRVPRVACVSPGVRPGDSSPRAPCLWTLHAGAVVCGRERHL